jgi:hypothetical protein
MKPTCKYDHDQEQIHKALGVDMSAEDMAKKMAELATKSLFSSTKSQTLALIIEESGSLEEAVLIAYMIGRSSSKMDAFMSK